MYKLNRKERKRITYITKEALNKRGDLSLITRFLINKSLYISVSIDDIYNNSNESKLLLADNKNFKVKVLKKKK